MEGIQSQMSGIQNAQPRRATRGAKRQRGGSGTMAPPPPII